MSHLQFYGATLSRNFIARQNRNGNSDMACHAISQQSCNTFLANVNSRSTFAICYRRSVWRLSVVCLSVTFVHPTQTVEIFSNVSSPLRGWGYQPSFIPHLQLFAHLCSLFVHLFEDPIASAALGSSTWSVCNIFVYTKMKKKVATACDSESSTKILNFIIISTHC